MENKNDNMNLNNGDKGVPIWEKALLTLKEASEYFCAV